MLSAKQIYNQVLICKYFYIKYPVLLLYISWCSLETSLILMLSSLFETTNSVGKHVYRDRTIHDETIVTNSVKWKYKSKDRFSKTRMKTSISSKAFCSITDRQTDKIFTEKMLIYEGNLHKKKLERYLN